MSPPEVDPAAVTRWNWRTGPFNRWAFSHVDEVVPVARIPAAPAPSPSPSPSPPGERTSLDGFALRAPGGETLDLDAFLHATCTDALVVLKAGRRVFEWGAPAQPHLLNSVSKAVTGLVAGVLAEAGELDLDAPVAAHVPEVVGTAYAGATLRRLLDMRVGVAADPAQTLAYEAAFSVRPSEAGGPLRTLRELIVQTLPDPGHVGTFRYVSANTDLAGWAIERAVGRPFAQVASERLWRPIGAPTDAAITVDAEGSPFCAGGVVATARDLARLGQVLLEDGAGAIAAAVAADLRGGGDPQAWRGGDWGSFFPFLGEGASYRSGWYWAPASGAAGVLFAMGTYGQNLFIDAAERLVVAKLSSLPVPIDPRAVWLAHAAVPEIARLVG